MKHMLKHLLIFVLIASISFLIVPWHQSKANAGPPSNLLIEILHFDQSYSLDVFILREHPPTQTEINQARAWLDCEEDVHCYDDLYPVYPYPSSLIEFIDRDGYVSNTLYGDVSFFYANQETQRYVMYLGVPPVFKIVLVNDSGHKIISDTIEMNDYNYTITWDLEGVSFTDDDQYDVGTISGLAPHPLLRASTYGYALIRLMITLVIELSIFALFGFIEKRSYVIVLLTNIVTQIVLTIFVLMIFFRGRGYMLGPLLIFMLGELIIFVVEMISHGFLIKEHTASRRVIYAFIANLASLIIGLIVMFSLLLSWFSF